MVELATASLIGLGSFLAGCAGYKLFCPGRHGDTEEESDEEPARGRIVPPRRLNAKSDLLVFPDTKPLCDIIYCGFFRPSPQKCNKRDCSYSHGTADDPSTLMKLYEILNQTKKSIDVCVYIITFPRLANFLKLLKERRGVEVRIIAHSAREDDNNKGNQIPDLIESGIRVKLRQNQPVKPGPSEALMHNKFFVIDKKIVGVGSFNWTHHAVFKNNESLLISSHKDAVRKFGRVFEDLWSKFSADRS